MFRVPSVRCLVGIVAGSGPPGMAPNPACAVRPGRWLFSHFGTKTIVSPAVFTDFRTGTHRCRDLAHVAGERSSAVGEPSRRSPPRFPQPYDRRRRCRRRRRARSASASAVRAGSMFGMASVDQATTSLLTRRKRLRRISNCNGPIALTRMTSCSAPRGRTRYGVGMNRRRSCRLATCECL